MCATIASRFKRLQCRWYTFGRAGLLTKAGTQRRTRSLKYGMLAEEERTSVAWFPALKPRRVEGKQNRILLRRSGSHGVRRSAKANTRASATPPVKERALCETRRETADCGTPAPEQLYLSSSRRPQERCVLIIGQRQPSSLRNHCMEKRLRPTCISAVLRKRSCLCVVYSRSPATDRAYTDTIFGV